MLKIFLILTSLLILVLISLNYFFLDKKVNSSLINTLPKVSQKEQQLPYPTLEKIFSENHTWVNNLPEDKKITLIATGDIIPARSVNFQQTSQKDFTWAFKNISDLLNSSDITFINLETPLLKNCPLTQEGMIFCGSAQNVVGLVLAGVDIASLANNHAGNHGEKGVKETVELLNTHHIDVTGINGPFIKEVKGIKFAFLGYDDITLPQPGVSNFSEEKMKREIAEAKSKADVVIVQFHWGVEYRAQPDERQKYLGHLAIDDGADLVIGNHPHWIQPIEIYQGKLITYAHGNTVFDQMWSEQTKKGVIGKYTFLGKDLVDVEYFPLYIKNYGQPSLLEGLEKQKILDQMREESLKLKTN